jgi:hypothetical protein
MCIYHTESFSCGCTRQSPHIYTPGQLSGEEACPWWTVAMFLVDHEELGYNIDEPCPTLRAIFGKCREVMKDADTYFDGACDVCLAAEGLRGRGCVE